MKVNEKYLADFENSLNPAFPERSGIPPKILGYGEISTTFAIPSMPGIAFKRMPPFNNDNEITTYKKSVIQYCEDLQAKAGIQVAPYDFHSIRNRDGELILYVSQPQFEADSIGNTILKKANERDLATLIQRLLTHFFTIEKVNRDNQPDYSIGIDGQISNWSFQDDGTVFYFDITTPMFRVNGKDQLDPEIFLKSSPFFLTWIIRLAFLKEVLDRYYDMRLVLIDLLANFHKEGRPELIAPMISFINEQIAAEGLSENIALLTKKEVDEYYKNDALIWKLFLSFRRIDRFLKTKLFGKKYNFILPGKIKR